MWTCDGWSKVSIHAYQTRLNKSVNTVTASRRASVRLHFGPPLSWNAAVYGQSCDGSIRINEILKRLTSLPFLMKNYQAWWWQCNIGYSLPLCPYLLGSRSLPVPIPRLVLVHSLRPGLWCNWHVWPVRYACCMVGSIACVAHRGVHTVAQRQSVHSVGKASHHNRGSKRQTWICIEMHSRHWPKRWAYCLKVLYATCSS